MSDSKSEHQHFIGLTREHHNTIVRIAGYYESDPHRQEDLYQEIVYQLWSSFGDFRGEAKFSTWLYRVAVNTSISHLRKKKQQPGWKFWQDGNRELPAGPKTDPVVQNEQKQLLYEHIAELDELDRTLVLLYLEDLEYQTIAEITGLTQSNVGVRLHRVRQKLKTMIEQTTASHGS